MYPLLYFSCSNFLNFLRFFLKKQYSLSMLSRRLYINLGSLSFFSYLIVNKEYIDRFFVVFLYKTQSIIKKREMISHLIPSFLFPSLYRKPTFDNALEPESHFSGCLGSRGDPSYSLFYAISSKSCLAMFFNLNVFCAVFRMFCWLYN